MAAKLCFWHVQVDLMWGSCQSGGCGAYPGRFGKMFCLAGIGGELSGFVQSARDVTEMVVIDGCSVGCGKAIFAKAGVPLKNYVVITDEDIEKNKDLTLQRADIETVKRVVKKSIEKSRRPPQFPGVMPVAGGCGCSSKG
jgi:hypothetical protein